MTRKPFYKSLYLQVLTAIVMGILLGYFYPVNFYLVASLTITVRFGNCGFPQLHRLTIHALKGAARFGECRIVGLLRR